MNAAIDDGPSSLQPVALSLEAFGTLKAPPRVTLPPPRMRYMVIETYLAGPGPVYARARERGRMLPDGLVYLDSWVDARGLDRCFQLMETDDATLLDEWIVRWSDIVAFEVVPVVGSAEAHTRS